MKKIYLVLLFCLYGVSAAFAQNVIDYSVRVSATLQKSPAQITLVWPGDPNASNYFVYRRAKGATTFGTVVATLKPSDTSYIDKNVTLGTSYQYEIVKTVKGGIYYGFGYISSGIEVPAIESRGKMILVYDKSFSATLQPRIDRLVTDLNGDGWQVITHAVDISDSVTQIHRLIAADYNADPQNVKSVFLLGHIPVPYSGGDLNNGLNPIDGHNYLQNQHPSHNGAWPADIYYGVMNGGWTDTYIYDTLGSYDANHNIPGDGKFDQDDIPASAVLSVGRVDMYDMPAFKPLTETDLIKRYLDKDHNWRMGLVPMAEKGLVKDYFGVVNGEAFAASGYKNFAPMFGPDNVTDTGTWENDLKKSSYLWSYGTGGGTFTSAGGISTTANFAKDSLRSVFMMLFGSWFGDWNVTDNYLRAPLASKGPILTDCWSGRPQWQFDPMAMGESIGYCTLLNFNEYSNGANDYTRYFRSILMAAKDRMVHVALMGDPSLRMHVVQPASNLRLTHSKLVVTLNWTASTDPGVVGYYIYRAASPDQAFTRLSTAIVSGTTFTDNSALHNKNYYMVRAVKLQTSPSGSYYNMSQGIIDTITTDKSAIMPGPVIEQVNIYPNPGQNTFHIMWPGSACATGTLQVYDVLGKLVINRPLDHLDRLQNIDIHFDNEQKGVYFLKIYTANKVYGAQLIKE